MKNFEQFFGIDWSGAKSPILTKAIAVSSITQDDNAPKLIEGPWSRASIANYLISLANGTKRTLVGIDCNFGYSEEIGEKQFGKDYTAHNLWRAVEIANQNVPNYFAGGFWTHESHSPYFWLSGKMPQGFFMFRRKTEEACGNCGLGWPESPFKLIGAKQVGKGGLAGMRLVHDLKERLGNRIAIWPFDDHVDDAMLVVTEIYPRLFLRMSSHGNTKIRTIKELNTVLAALRTKPINKNTRFSDHQADAIVSAAGLRLLCGQGNTVPENIANPAVDRRTLKREGWIFGVRDKA